jgi:tetratricopeptide (TPR) repeat protein
VVLAALLSFGFVTSAEADYRLECPSQDVDRAIRDCTIAIGIGRANLPEAYAVRCVARWLKGAFARAMADCERAIKLGADFAAAHHIRGIASAEKGDHQAAVADYSRSLELTPTTSAYYNRGTAYLALGDSAAALADFDRAIAGEPRVPQAHVNRALALLASGRSAEVAADLDRAVELLHGDSIASAIRRQVLEKLGPAPGTAVSNTAVPAELPVPIFPPSKVLPPSISLETFSGRPLRVPSTLIPRAAPALSSPSEAPPIQREVPLQAPATAKARPATRQDSFAECVRLWNPEARTSLRQWNEICRRLDFVPPNSGSRKP